MGHPAAAQTTAGCPTCGRPALPGRRGRPVQRGCPIPGGADAASATAARFANSAGAWTSRRWRQCPPARDPPPSQASATRPDRVAIRALVLSGRRAAPRGAGHRASRPERRRRRPRVPPRDFLTSEMNALSILLWVERPSLRWSGGRGGPAGLPAEPGAGSGLRRVRRGRGQAMSRAGRFAAARRAKRGRPDDGTQESDGCPARRPARAER